MTSADAPQAATVLDLVTGSVERARTLDGEPDEAALFAAVSRPLGRATVEAGGRWTRIEHAEGAVPGLLRDRAEQGFVDVPISVPG